MNIKTITNMPLKEKKSFVFESCLMYKKLKLINSKTKLLEKHRRKNVFLKNYDKTNQKSISFFESMLNLLEPEQRLIINKEYLEEQTIQNWYQEKWSKTTYYKIKHQAIDNFLFLIYG